MHATQIQGFFNIPADDISALSIIGKYFKEKNLDDIVVVSPDHGGTTRARKLAEMRMRQSLLLISAVLNQMLRKQ